MEPKGLLLCPQEPASRPYTGTVKSGPHPHTIFLKDICFNIIITLCLCGQSGLIA